jgi:hypothetical protein
MADPAQSPATTYPEAGRNDQPKEAAQKLAVVDLSHAWYQKTQDGRIPGFRHYLIDASS